MATKPRNPSRFCKKMTLFAFQKQVLVIKALYEELIYAFAVRR